MLTEQNIQIIHTSDGSNSLFSKDFKESYHSTFGAIQESRHIFIQNGLVFCKKQEIKILEIGFGTGLNAFLSYIEGLNANLTIEYHTIEKFPVSLDLVNQLNYSDLLGYSTEFKKIQSVEWDKMIAISNNFMIKKIKEDLLNYKSVEKFDLVYFDAFSPEIQPELWTESVFRNVAAFLMPGAILTTYSCKGIVKRNLRSAGFKVEKIPGPPGKREIIRAVKQ